MRFLVIGDIVGRTGRRAVSRLLGRMKADTKAEIIIANGENAAGGFGVTRPVVEEIFKSGVDIITTGNHVWDQKEARFVMDEEPNIIRPANYPPGTPGRGWMIFRKTEGVEVAVINLSGRIFMGSMDCPFRMADQLVTGLLERTSVILIDFHAEATSEKQALGWYLDGRASAVWGTHTHVQTNDARVLPGGTAYITDVGMAGPRDSVIGMKTDIIVQKFLSQMPARFEVAGEPAQIDAIVIDIDPNNGRALDIRPVRYLYEIECQ